ncbi:PASTA domain-containing protein [Micromonospora sp. IBSANI012]|uniref:PASTA domain-containing protein n=1 Tax=Micromonospora sp. IBSANI012 TaxID=3457761 RepID=UPI00405824DE
MSKGAQAVVTVLGVLLALFLAPVIGAVWGLWVVATWLLRRGGEEAPSAGKAVGAACVALASVAFGAAVYPSVFAERDPVSASSVSAVASPTPPTPPVTSSPFVRPTVPDAVGSAPFAATGLITAAGLRWTMQDASPLARDMYIQKNWTVVATEPPAGTPVAPSSEVTILVLKNEEAAWFAAHPTMPRLPKGKPTDTLTERGGILGGMNELVLVRYDRTATPKDASEPTTSIRSTVGNRPRRPRPGPG